MSYHFIARSIGSIRSTTDPFWKMRIVPVDSETAIATASVALEIAAPPSAAPRGPSTA
ncbi:MAG: hypothetical protein WD066_02820 [Planctomycetaceae bacterium]